MGCKLGKLASSTATGNTTKQDEPPPPAPTDPRLPLTARQKYTMVASWKGISRAIETTGVNMFVRLFEENSDILQLFEKFKLLKTKEEQLSSDELQEHATTVMDTLDEGIRTLDNVDAFNDFLHQVGALHRKVPGFKVEYFWRIEKPFLDAVKTTLGDRYTENVEAIYNITIKFILETLITGFNASGKA